jgi:hypothetical protein
MLKQCYKEAREYMYTCSIHILLVLLRMHIQFEMTLYHFLQYILQNIININEKKISIKEK